MFVGDMAESDVPLLLDDELNKSDTSDSTTTYSSSGCNKNKKSNHLREKINRNVVQLRLLSFMSKRKSYAYLTAIILIIFFVNLTINYDGYWRKVDSLIIKRNLHSQVPGMKEWFNETVPKPPPADYLVWSENCKMLNLDPYRPEVMNLFRRQKYETCKLISPLTQVKFNRTTERYTLSVDQDVIHSYSKTGKLDCCYQTILRNYTGEESDNYVGLSECMTFINKTSLASPIDNILVRCRFNNRQVYINGYPLMHERKEIRHRLETWKKYDAKLNKKEKTPSVLMLGIDSISRLNLIRAMPKTAKYLYDNEWFEMSGYNKIRASSIPNKMCNFNACIR